MSLLSGGAEGATLIRNDDQRLASIALRTRLLGPRATDRALSYATPWWPPRGGFCGNTDVDVGILAATQSANLTMIAQGAASRVGFAGVTRDANGTPIGGVTCSLFRTSDRLWIMDIISNANGGFLLQSWFSPDQHFIVFYKAGTPDIFGATKQTIVGA